MDKHAIAMELRAHTPYEAPMIQVYEVNPEGVVCESGYRDDYGNAFEI